MLVALGESYEKLGQQVEAKKVGRSSKSVQSKSICIMVRVSSDLLCVWAVLLEGLLSGGCGENGSAQAGKVSDLVTSLLT